MDAAITHLVVSGQHEQALCQMTACYHTPLVRFCTGFIGNRMEAEEIVQEVFIQAWESMPHFRAESSAKVWLFGIARRLCSRHMKRKKRRFSLFQRWIERQPEHKSIDLEVETMERKKFVEHALQKLKPQLREAVLLRYQQGMSNDELAAALDVRPATARKRVSLGLKALRERLAPLLKEAPQETTAKAGQSHLQGPLPAALHPDEEAWPITALQRAGR